MTQRKNTSTVSRDLLTISFVSIIKMEKGIGRRRIRVGGGRRNGVVHEESQKLEWWVLDLLRLACLHESDFAILRLTSVAIHPSELFEIERDPASKVH